MKLEPLVRWYQELSPDSVERVVEFYDENARFIDPFNDVTGQRAIANIFHHMFANSEVPRFHITDSPCISGNTAWVKWCFHCEIRKHPITIEGVSQLQFGEDGRVVLHHDYWDTAELFAQLPLIGTMVQLLRRKMSASAYTDNLNRERHEQQPQH